MSKFNSYFVHNCEVVGSPYSSTDMDFMDGAESICAWADDNTNSRVARLLNEMTHYYNLLSELSGKQGYYRVFYSWAFRKYYSLSVRLYHITGMYAYVAIMGTCELPAPRDLF